jgi:ribosomal protein L11 methyltransferase
VIDGIVSPVTQLENEASIVDERRFDDSPMAIFDVDLIVLESLAASLKIEFRESVLFEIQKIPDAAWMKCWEPDFKPWTTDKFSIYPLGQTSIDVTKISLEIDARDGAFGTGQHATTRCLLKLIEDSWSSICPRSVLDVGCGTGILAIASARLGATVVFGTEIDQDLLTLAQENAIRCGTSVQLRLLENPRLLGQNFDLVIANILAPVLVELMFDLAECVRPGGVMLLSGFIDKEKESVADPANKHGLRLVDQVSENGWCGLMFRKDATNPLT